MQSEIMDCACVIHGDAYDWQYVENLQAMIQRNTWRQVRMHVYTEPDRAVPNTMIKHELTLWPGISGPKKSWWYKMQMFDPDHHRGRLLYFDLDVVITGSIDWIWDNSNDKSLQAPRDFRRIWRPNWTGINSSVLCWNTRTMRWIWEKFCEHNIAALTRQYHGDQDYLNSVIPSQGRHYLDENRIKSWRWQVQDGGIDAKTRQYCRPGAGAVIDPATRIIIFHGQPKPHEVQDPRIQQLWHAG